MEYPSVGLLSALLLLTTPHPGASIVTPYHPVPECAADAPFIVPNFKANWFKAVEYCHYLGRSLVTVATEQRQQTLDQLLDDGAHQPRDQSFWCGANDLADAGSFHWHLTGRPVALGWSNWADERHRREPADADDAYKVRCVSLSRTADVVEELQQQQQEGEGEGGAAAPPAPFSWIWTVANCWRELYFICERTGVSSCR
uniref:C-type lectin domain-containing protein n=1 Tax=Anopheles coluzzii TaxID=1518534 RepID=A0A6E8W6V9_ANOCL